MKKAEYEDRFRGNEQWYNKKMKLLDEKIISYSCCHMSNTKWRKLFLTILKNTDIIKECEIVEFVFKGADSYWINNMRLTKDIAAIDEFLFEDYICEQLAGGHDPISFREIDYIEFRKYYYKKELCPSSHSAKAEQDLDEIKNILSAAGQFHWGETEQYLRVLGYS